MGLNCKPGDLAIVVNDIDFPINVGKLVKVIEAASEERFGDLMGIFHWDCLPCGGSLRGWSSDDEGSYLDDCESTAIQDKDLRPIKPLDELDDVTSDNEVTA